MRLALCAAVALCAATAQGQTAISGTFSANYAGTNSFGQPTVSLSLNLSCSLSCSSSSPTLHYGVAGGGDGHFLAAPSEKAGYVSSGFLSSVDPSGSATSDNTSFPAGSNFNVTAKSVTCHCGNATGQGGYIDLTTPDVHIPPFIGDALLGTTVGTNPMIIIHAAPRGGETLDVQASGAGVTFSRSYSQADVGGSDSVMPDLTPSQAGALTVTAVVSPGGAVATKTFDVQGGSGGSSGGGGGNSSSGSGDGSGSSGGCSAAPGAPCLAALALLAGLRRREHRR